jgi:hypothetical protein
LREPIRRKPLLPAAFSVGAVNSGPSKSFQHPSGKFCGKAGNYRRKYLKHKIFQHFALERVLALFGYNLWFKDQEPDGNK